MAQSTLFQMHMGHDNYAQTKELKPTSVTSLPRLVIKALYSTESWAAHGKKLSKDLRMRDKTPIEQLASAYYRHISTWCDYVSHNSLDSQHVLMP